MHKHAKATLGSGNLKAAVQLPPKEDMDEWLAVNSKSTTYLVCFMICFLIPTRVFPGDGDGKYWAVAGYFFHSLLLMYGFSP